MRTYARNIQVETNNQSFADFHILRFEWYKFRGDNTKVRTKCRRRTMWNEGKEENCFIIFALELIIDGSLWVWECNLYKASREARVRNTLRLLILNTRSSGLMLVMLSRLKMWSSSPAENTGWVGFKPLMANARVCRRFLRAHLHALSFILIGDHCLKYAPRWKISPAYNRIFVRVRASVVF